MQLARAAAQRHYEYIVDGSKPLVRVSAAFVMGRRAALPGQGTAGGRARQSLRAGSVASERSASPCGRALRLETDLSDRIQRRMWAGACEPHVRECFGAILDPGAVYFDVGAHIDFTLHSPRIGLGLKDGSSLLKPIRAIMSAWRAIFLNSTGQRRQTRLFGTAQARLHSNDPQLRVNQAGGA